MKHDKKLLVIAITVLLLALTVGCGRAAENSDMVVTNAAEETRVCEETQSAATAPVIHEHIWKTTVAAPTCTEKGYTQYTCTACGEGYTADETDAVGHSYVGEITVKPDCTAAGVKTYTCAVCDDIYTEAVAVADHHYESAITAPTCQKRGYTTHTCSFCGDTYVDTETAKTEHRYTGAVTRKPGCEAAGIKTFICATCGDTYTETVAATGHSYSTCVTEPTCDKSGYTTHTCADCGDSYTDSETAATGHSWGSWRVTKEAEEDAEGIKERVCGTCGKTETETIPKVHYHSFVVTSQTEATCTEDGVINRACACGATNFTTMEFARGHRWKTCEQEEVGHYESYIYCHCGNWSCPTAEGRYDLAFADHVDADHNGEWWEWSYYGRNVWVVDVPGYSYEVCTRCNATQ